MSETNTVTPSDDVTTVLKQKYGAIAAHVGRDEPEASCCVLSRCDAGGTDAITRDLYDAEQAGDVTAEAKAASLGCGNPTAFAELRLGETVRDLGSGGGVDVLLSARRIGLTGKAYGLDMTDEMLAVVWANQRAAGNTNVEFLKEEIEAIPLPDNLVDVIISNCAINLSGDKDRMLAEAFRVLRSGGRLAVSDVVRRREVSAALQRSVELWIGCVAGALHEHEHEKEYRGKLAGSGFEEVGVEPTRIYQADDARAVLTAAGFPADAGTEVDGAFMSAFVRAVKPCAVGSSLETGSLRHGAGVA